MIHRNSSVITDKLAGGEQDFYSCLSVLANQMKLLEPAALCIGFILKLLVYQIYFFH